MSDIALGRIAVALEESNRQFERWTSEQRQFKIAALAADVAYLEDALAYYMTEAMWHESLADERANCRRELKRAERLLRAYCAT